MAEVDLFRAVHPAARCGQWKEGSGWGRVASTDEGD